MAWGIFRKADNETSNANVLSRIPLYQVEGDIQLRGKAWGTRARENLSFKVSLEHEWPQHSVAWRAVKRKLLFLVSLVVARKQTVRIGKEDIEVRSSLILLANWKPSFLLAQMPAAASLLLMIFLMALMPPNGWKNNTLRLLLQRFNLLLFSCQIMSDSLWPHELHYARLPCPLPTPRVCSDSCPLNRWCHPTISSSATPFSFCPQSFPGFRSLTMSQLFKSGGQSIGASVSASILPMNIRYWFPLRFNN